MIKESVWTKNQVSMFCPKVNGGYFDMMGINVVVSEEKEGQQTFLTNVLYRRQLGRSSVMGAPGREGARHHSYWILTKSPVSPFPKKKVTVLRGEKCARPEGPCTIQEKTEGSESTKETKKRSNSWREERDSIESKMGPNILLWGFQKYVLEIWKSRE